LITQFYKYEDRELNSNNIAPTSNFLRPT